jgi:hypothetical protein
MVQLLKTLMSPRATSPFLQDFVDVSIKSKQFVVRHVAKGEKGPGPGETRSFFLLPWGPTRSALVQLYVFNDVNVNCTFEQRVQSVERMRIHGQQRATSSFLFFSFSLS